MKTLPERLKEIISLFPQTSLILSKLDNNNITYAIGGSTALYLQGMNRRPHDVDLIFTAQQHKLANRLFNISSTPIERTNVAMFKSSPTSDGSVDFLSEYKVMSGGVTYYSPPIEKTFVTFGDREISLMPAEKIAVLKLIGLREHHSDSKDVHELLSHPNFDHALFWNMVNVLQAQKIIRERLERFKL